MEDVSLSLTCYPVNFDCLLAPAESFYLGKESMFAKVNRDNGWYEISEVVEKLKGRNVARIQHLFSCRYQIQVTGNVENMALAWLCEVG